MPTDVLTRLQRSWWVLLIFGLIAVGFGLVALFMPFATAVAMAWTLGVMALAEGVISLFALFRKDHEIPKGWLALYAIASIAFGLLAIFNPAATAAVLVLLLAAWLIVAGIFRIVLAIRIRKQIRGEWLLVLSGALAIVLGGLFVLWPAAGLVAATVWIGFAALFYGVLQIFAGLRLRKLFKPG